MEAKWMTHRLHPTGIHDCTTKDYASSARAASVYAKVSKSEGNLGWKKRSWPAIGARVVCQMNIEAGIGECVIGCEMV